MGSSASGSWLLGLIIYFFVFIVMVTFVSNMQEGITYSSDNILSATGSNDYCDTPRYTYNTDFELVKNIYPNTKDCRATLGTYAKETCEFIEGCIWDNVTSGWWIFSSTYESCTGEVNTSYYNNGTETFEICSMSGLQGRVNNGLCGLMGCTYYTEKDLNVDDLDTTITGVIKQVNSFTSVIISLASFDADIGIPEDYEFLFSFIFFYIPLFMLIMVIAMYIRG